MYTRGSISTLEVLDGVSFYGLLTHLFQVLIKLPPPKVISGLLSNIQKVGLFCVILGLFPLNFRGPSDVLGDFSISAVSPPYLDDHLGRIWNEIPTRILEVCLPPSPPSTPAAVEGLIFKNRQRFSALFGCTFNLTRRMSRA